MVTLALSNRSLTESTRATHQLFRTNAAMNLIHSLSTRASHLYIQIWHVISGRSHRRFKQLQRDWVISQQNETTLTRRLANAERQIAELHKNLTASKNQEASLAQDLAKVIDQRNQLQQQLEDVSQQLRNTVSSSQKNEAELTQNLKKVEQKYLTLQKNLQRSIQELQETLAIAQQKEVTLRDHLAELGNQKTVLQKELDDLLNYFDAEVQTLEAELDSHQDALATCQIDLGLALATPSPKTLADSTSTPQVSLVDWKIALIGGHENTTRGVRQKLSQSYGLQTMIEIPSIHMSQQQLRQKLENCHLIVSIVGYSNHPLTTSISQLKSKGALKGEILPVNCRGVSGVVRDIMSFVENNQTSEQMDS